MIRLAVTGLLERWQTYLGALVTTALGVGLVQASLLLLLAVADTGAPAGASAVLQAQLNASRVVAITVVAVTLGFSALLAVFIIASTFAFSVTERLRDLALLRIVGADVAQVRRMLLGEAVALGLGGALVGIPVGVGLAHVQTRMLIGYGFIPGSLTVSFQPWTIPASLALGVALALGGVAVAARRAARIEPLDAIRATGAAARPMTRGRWVVGIALTAATAALVITAPFGGLAGAQAMAMSAGITAALAITAMAPALVPLVAGVIPRARSTVGWLAMANLRDAATRSASTAAPLVVLVALVLSQPIAMLSFSHAATQQLARGTHADLVLHSEGLRATDAEEISGVSAASTEWTLPVGIQPSGSAISGLSPELAGTPLAVTTEALVVDPVAFAVAHPGASDAVAGLEAGDAAPGPGAAGLGLGSAGALRVGDRPLGTVDFGTAVPAGSAHPVGIVVARTLVPDEILATVPATTFVVLEDGADRGAVEDELTRLGRVTDLDTWTAEAERAGQDQNAQVLVVVMVVGALYTVIGVLNAIAMALSGRRREFDVARATGLTRRQVLTSATLETLLIGGAATVLATAATGTTVIGVLASTAHLTGAAALIIPWPLVAAVVGGGLALTGLAGAVAAAAAARHDLTGSLLARN